MAALSAAVRGIRREWMARLETGCSPVECAPRPICGVTVQAAGRIDRARQARQARSGQPAAAGADPVGAETGRPAQ